MEIDEHKIEKKGEGNETNEAGAGDPTAELEQCKKEREEYLAGWQRAKADFINYKRDELKRFEELAKYANEALLKDLITVLDNFDLGIRILEKAGSAEKGVYMIRTNLEDVAKRYGLERVTIAPGSPYDPAIAEVITETESGEPPGTVLEEIAPAYRLHGKIIRPARVKVSRGEGTRNKE